MQTCGSSQHPPARSRWQGLVSWEPVFHLDETLRAFLRVAVCPWEEGQGAYTPCFAFPEPKFFHFYNGRLQWLETG